MKCPCTCTCFPLIIALVIVIGIFVYLRFRKDIPLFASFKRICSIKFSIYNLTYPYKLLSLPYNYNALEPHLDAETMTIHHTKHHQAYVDNLNKALEGHPELQKSTIEALLVNLDALPKDIRKRVRDNAGGHFNHTLFWDIMSPNGGGHPSTDVLTEILKNFGSFQTFKEQFEKIALSHVGSGWTWLCLTPQKKLTIIATLNHDTPLALGMYPLLVLDIWEHAYYLKYRNKRADFITAWWNVVNWKQVEKLYHNGIKVLS